MNNRRKEYRRKVERRAPKEGVTIRCDDNIKVLPKRIRWAEGVPSLRELVDKHGLIAGGDGNIYFGKDAETFINQTMTPPSDEQQGDKK